MSFHRPFPRRYLARSLVAAVSFAVLPATAHADAVESFYRGKTLDFLIGAAVGGAYDLPGRIVAHHLGKHIPGNPSVVVRNMVGGNGLTMTNHLYNVAPKDGTVIGMPNNAIPLEPLLKILSPDGSNVRFDVRKLQWIGSPAQETYVSFVWHTAPAKSFEDLRRTEILTGGTASLGEAVALPKLMNALAGTRFNIVKGYGGQNDIFLAMERGELQANTAGLTNLTSSRADWVRDHKIRALVQYTGTEKGEKSSILRGVPSAVDLVPTDSDRTLLRFLFAKYRMARVIFAAPEVVAERIQALRAAFDATMTDSAFLDESAKVGLEVKPVGGRDVAKLIQELYATPNDVVERARSILLSDQR
jgi:tripartite-type tricarboxylate transporter receptor subunit TctC